MELCARVQTGILTHVTVKADDTHVSNTYRQQTQITQSGDNAISVLGRSVNNVGCVMAA